MGHYIERDCAVCANVMDCIRSGKIKKHRNCGNFRDKTPPPMYTPPPSKVSPQKKDKASLRPCVVNGEKALFHKWVEKEDVILKLDGLQTPEEVRLIRKEFSRTGCISPYFTTEKIKSVCAVVEYEGGRVGEAKPSDVRFLDNRHSEYDFTEREAQE